MYPQPKRSVGISSMLLVCFAVVACEDSTGPTQAGGPSRSVSGRVIVHPTLAAGVVLLAELDGDITSTEDVVTLISSGAISSTPLTLAAGSTSRTYVYQLPEDPRGFGGLVAFMDLDRNGILDPSREPVRLALKQIDGVRRAISTWTWTRDGDNHREYAVGYVGTHERWSIDLIETNGFDFNFGPSPGDFAYVTHPGSATVSVVDLATNTVSATVTVGVGEFANEEHRPPKRR